MFEIIQVYKLYSYYVFLYTVDSLYNKICVQVLMDCTCLCLYVCVHKIYLFSSSLNLWIFLYELLIFFFFSCVFVYGVYSCVHKCDPMCGSPSSKIFLNCSSTPRFLRQGLSFKPRTQRYFQSDQSSFCGDPISSLLEASFTDELPHICMGSGNVNSGLLACLASTLTVGPSSQT